MDSEDSSLSLLSCCQISLGEDQFREARSFNIPRTPAQTFKKNCQPMMSPKASLRRLDRHQMKISNNFTSPTTPSTPSYRLKTETPQHVQNNSEQRYFLSRNNSSYQQFFPPAFPITPKQTNLAPSTQQKGFINFSYKNSENPEYFSTSDRPIKPTVRSCMELNAFQNEEEKTCYETTASSKNLRGKGKISIAMQRSLGSSRMMS